MQPHVLQRCGLHDSERIIRCACIDSSPGSPGLSRYCSSACRGDRARGCMDGPVRPGSSTSVSQYSESDGPRRSRCRAMVRGRSDSEVSTLCQSHELPRATRTGPRTCQWNNGQSGRWRLRGANRPPLYNKFE